MPAPSSGGRDGRGREPRRSPSGGASGPRSPGRARWCCRGSDSTCEWRGPPGQVPCYCGVSTDEASQKAAWGSGPGLFAPLLITPRRSRRRSGHSSRHPDERRAAPLRVRPSHAAGKHEFLSITPHVAQVPAISVPLLHAGCFAHGMPIQCECCSCQFVFARLLWGPL